MDNHEQEMKPTTSKIVESTNESQIRKRRLSESIDQLQDAKRFIPNSENTTNGGGSELLKFSDEILLKIIHSCNSASLYALSKTCKHLLRLVADRTLWRTFDLSTMELMGKRIKKFLTKIPKSDIKEFKVRGLVPKYPDEKWKDNTLTVHMLRILSAECPILESMELFDAFINFDKIKISDFPRTLERLFMSNCRIPTRSNRLFSKIDDFLPQLFEISLEYCPWFETHDLVVFSKLPNLKRISLRGCSSLKGCVPYGSIATRFGFKKLEYLDVRDTPICDSDIQCFNITTTLRELLLECPPKRHVSVLQPTIYGASTSRAHTNRTPNGSSSHVGSINGNTNDDDDESGYDCSSDSEDNDSEDDESIINARTGETRDEHPHYIQVVLQNDPPIDIAENNLQRYGRLRYVIGIISRDNGNAHTANETAEVTVQNLSNIQAQPEQTVNLPRPNQNLNVNGARQRSIYVGNVPDQNQPGPSGLQSNQNRAINAVPPVNVEVVAPNIEQPDENSPQIEALVPPQVILVQNRENQVQECRRISWELHPLHHRADNLYPPTNGENGPASNYPIISSISDRGMCSFGIPQRNVQEGVIWIRAEVRPADTLLERITIRNYRSVTDVTLRHLAICAPNLRYLDLTGTSVTKEGIAAFLQSKPDCRVVSHFVE